MVARRVFFLRAARLAGMTSALSVLAACARPTESPPSKPTSGPAPATSAPAKTEPKPAEAAKPAAPPTSAPAPAPATAAPAAAPAAAKLGGTLTAAIFADPLTVDPHLAGNPEGRATTRAVHDRLLAVDQQGRIVPMLVESWEQPDERTYLLNVRQGVKFHDGTPLDAEAVRINLERVRNPDLKSIRATEISAMDKAETVNGRTLRITLKEPFAAFLFAFTDVAGCIASPAALERWGRDYGFHPVGTGPFKFVEYQKDVNTVLEKNPEYWVAGKPMLDRLVLRPIPVDSSRLAELRSGGVQIAEALPFQDIQRLRQMSEIVVSEKEGFRVEYFAINTRPEYPGSSHKLRQAFQAVLDREAIHQTVYFSTGSVAYDGILPGSPFHDASYKPFDHDVDRARRLVDESGLSKPITLTALLQADPVKRRFAELLQAMVEPIGIKINIEQVDGGALQQRQAAGTEEIGLNGWWGYRADPDQYLYRALHSTGIYAGFYAYKNPKMDALFAAERAGREESERRRIFREMSQVMNDDAVYHAYHYGSDYKGLSPRVKGFDHRQDAITVYEDLSLA